MISPLITVIGYCSSTTAKIFCCATNDPSQPPQFARIAWSSGNAIGRQDIQLIPAKPYEYGVFNLKGLPDSAGITYNIYIADDKGSLPDAGAMLAETNLSSFRLLPSHRQPRIVLLSCNGAYEITDPEKKFDMWPVLLEQIKEGKVDLIIHAGDQVYSDPLVKKYRKEIGEMERLPDQLLDKLTEEYRRLYVEQTWGSREVSAVLASCPSVMMWDDHDIYDGWGSNDDDDSAVAQLFFKAAKQAFCEFQDSHNPERIESSSYACGFVQSDTGFLIADGRSHRMYKEQRVLGQLQMRSIHDWFMSQPESLKRIILVLGIPPVHAKFAHVFTVQKLFPFSKKFITDLRDTWLSPGNREECSQLMDIVFDFIESHKNTEVTILAGDVHVGSIGKLERKRNSKLRTTSTVWQVTSSGIGSPPPGGMVAFILEQLTKFSHKLGNGITGKLLPVMPGKERVMLRRNFALLSMDEEQTASKKGDMKVKFFAEYLEKPQVVMLDSQVKK